MLGECHLREDTDEEYGEVNQTSWNRVIFEKVTFDSMVMLTNLKERCIDCYSTEGDRLTCGRMRLYNS